MSGIKNINAGIFNQMKKNKKYKYQSLRGSFSDVYFGAKEKGTWMDVGWLKYAWLFIFGYEVRKIKS